MVVANKDEGESNKSLILLICGVEKNHSVTQTSPRLLPNSYQVAGGDQHTGIGVKLIVED